MKRADDRVKLFKTEPLIAGSIMNDECRVHELQKSIIVHGLPYVFCDFF